ncbi:MAG: hypothetical protein IPI12_14265 [Ignavibacteriales bacterium]|nr:hypothetical protein [Ignavibacteriales bacterium]
MFTCNGLEGFTADIGAERTLEGTESFWARMQVVNAAKAAGIQAIDSVFSDVGDMEGLVKSTLESKSFGFEGKDPSTLARFNNSYCLCPTSER